jgi:ribonuclease P protein component
MLILSIRTRQDFIDIQNNKDEICHRPTMILLIKATPKKYTQVTFKRRAGEFVRLGLTVTKKIDKRAVKRNKIKRRLREAFRKINPDLLHNHTDYQIIAKKCIVDSKLKYIVKDLEICLAKKGKSEFSVKKAKKAK